MVERRIGNAEVTGSIPVSSLADRLGYSLSAFFVIVLSLGLISIGVIMSDIVLKLDEYEIAPVFDESLLENIGFSLTESGENKSYILERPLKFGDEQFNVLITQRGSKITSIELRFTVGKCDYSIYSQYLRNLLGEPTSHAGMVEVDKYEYSWGKIVGVNEFRMHDGNIRIRYN